MGKKNIGGEDETQSASSLFSPEEYKKGDISIRQEVGEQLNKYLLRGAGYLFTTVLGALIVIVWDLNSNLREVQGKLSLPEKHVEMISIRVDKLEQENRELMNRNFELQVQNMKLELEIKNQKKHVN